MGSEGKLVQEILLPVLVVNTQHEGIPVGVGLPAGQGVDLGRRFPE